MALNQIPYTNVHELNLDWVLAKIQEFDAKIRQFQETIDEFAEYVHILAELEPRVTALENDYSQLRTYVSELESELAETARLVSDLASSLDTEKDTRAAADADLQRQIDTIKSSITNLAGLEARMRLYVDQKIKASDLRTDAKLYKVYLKMNEYYIELMGYIDDLYDLLEHVATDIYNYAAYAYSTDGRITFDLNNWLVYLHCGNALSAQEYCSLGLSADEYAAFNLTAERYLMYSRKELHYDYVFMPLSGVKQETSVALSEAVNAVFDTLSASEYAGMDLDADSYDALDLTANEYRRLNSDGDLTQRIRHSVHGSGITAEEYSKLYMID